MNLEMDILVEDDVPRPGWASGRTANYLKVRFPAEELEPGQIVRVRLERIERGELIGCPLGKERYELSASSRSASN